MRNSHIRYDWNLIQADVDAGLRYRAIHKKYGLLHASWYGAIARRALVVPPLPKEPTLKEKLCKKCGSVKPIDSFHLRNPMRGTRNCQCIDCQAIYHRGHYEANRTDYMAKSSRRRLEFSAWWAEFKSTLTCSKCNESHVACLDFHHRDPSQKDVTIARVARGDWSKERVISETSKCDVLCSNCHRKLHYSLRKGVQSMVS